MAPSQLRAPTGPRVRAGLRAPAGPKAPPSRTGNPAPWVAATWPRSLSAAARGGPAAPPAQGARATRSARSPRPRSGQALSGRPPTVAREAGPETQPAEDPRRARRPAAEVRPAVGRAVRGSLGGRTRDRPGSAADSRSPRGAAHGIRPGGGVATARPGILDFRRDAVGVDFLPVALLAGHFRSVYLGA